MISMTLPQYRRAQCTINGCTVQLRPMWAETLATLLVSPPDRFVCKDTLIGELWPNPDLEPEYAANIVDKHIYFLRGLGVEIENASTFGWRIPEHARGQMIEMRRAA